MPADLVLAPEAVQDLADAYLWYEERRAGLGEEFLHHVEASLETIRRTPTVHAVIDSNFRRALVRRFPYAIFFENNLDRTTVYAVLHVARDPEKWRRRMPQ
jgi:plasmid stabilization system protein ParE